jgi:hypothetical protein
MLSIAPSAAPVLTLRVPQILLRRTPRPPRRLQPRHLQRQLENLPGPAVGASLTRLFADVDITVG